MQLTSVLSNVSPRQCWARIIWLPAHGSSCQPARSAVPSPVSLVSFGLIQLILPLPADTSWLPYFDLKLQSLLSCARFFFFTILTHKPNWKKDEVETWQPGFSLSLSLSLSLYLSLCVSQFFFLNILFPNPTGDDRSGLSSKVQYWILPVAHLHPAGTNFV